MRFKADIRRAIITLVITSIIGSLVTSLYQFMNSRDISRNTMIQATYWNMRSTSTEIVDIIVKRKYATFIVVQRLKEGKDFIKHYEEYYKVIREWNEKIDGIVSKTSFDLDYPFGLTNSASTLTSISYNCEDMILSNNINKFDKTKIKQHIVIITHCFREIHRRIREYYECLTQNNNSGSACIFEEKIIHEIETYIARIICLMNNRILTTREYLGNTNYWLLNIFRSADELDVKDINKHMNVCFIDRKNEKN